MSKADRRIKCPVCSSMIEVGDDIVWEKFRWYGVDRNMPMHASHDSRFQLMQTKLDELMARAEKESQYDPSDTWVI